MEACVQGHSTCVEALLEAGAKVHSKWQNLSPIQWASKHENAACVEACRRGGGRLRPLPVGTRSASDAENRLLPPPLRAARPRRSLQSVHAASASGDLGRGSARSQHWSGQEWVHSSLLAAVAGGKGEHANRSRQLKQRYPCLAGLGGAVRAYLWPQTVARSRPRLPPRTVASLSLRHGLRLRRAGVGGADIDRRVRAARYATPTPTPAQTLRRGRASTPPPPPPLPVHRSTADALYFGPVGAASQFVALRHEDEQYKYFFGELLLCFHFAHEGDEHECVLVEYLWPEIGKEDGLPLDTRYTHTPKRVLAVVSVEAVLFVAPLFAVLPMGAPGPHARRVYVLNDDVYAHF